MKRRSRAVIACAVVGVVSLPLLFCNGVGRKPFDQSTADHIRVGMSKAEVVREIGCPPGDYSEGPTWYPPSSYLSRIAFEWWEDENGAIGVLFDDDDRVANVLVETRVPLDRKGSIWTRIWRRLGL